MNHTFRISLFLLGLTVATNAAMTFVHPGTLGGKAELDFVKTKIAAGAEPWISQFNSMKSVEGLSAAPSPETTIDANNNGNNSRDDARRAYGNALAWYLTGEDAYAQQAIAYLNAWSGLQSITATDQQKLLQGGWIGALFGPAADIMLGYPGWQATDIENMRAMFRRAFYPVLNTASTWNGNVDLTQIVAMMSIAVFNEDETEFNLGLTRLASRMPRYFYLTTDTRPNANTWSNPTAWVDGLTQETCRDNNHHAQFALSAAVGAAEVAWQQGVDVYTQYQPRLVAAMELMGKQSSSGSMQGTCADDATSGDVYDTWEIGYNHYHVRKGIAMPNTWDMISRFVRNTSSDPGSWNIFYETLTHADIVYAGGTPIRKPIGNSGNGFSASLAGSGTLTLQSNQGSTFRIVTRDLKGIAVGNAQVNLSRGESKSIATLTKDAPAGIYWVIVSDGSSMKSIQLVR